MEGSNRVLNSLLQFRPDVAGTPQDVGHAGRPGHVVDGSAAVFSRASAPCMHGQRMAQRSGIGNRFENIVFKICFYIYLNDI
jgi:hypothetical protein